MSRIYKFQGKVKEDGRLVRGDLVHEPFGLTIQYIKDGEWVKAQVDPESVGQFTGYYDKKRTEEFPNGQEIYEGDIVSSPSAFGTVYGKICFGMYENLHSGFYINWENKSHGLRQDLPFWVPKLEVIQDQETANRQNAKGEKK